MSSQLCSIYVIEPTHQVDKVSLEQVWTQGTSEGLGAGYTSLVPIQMSTGLVLCAYNKATQQTDAYMLSAGASWVAPVSSRINLGSEPWDSIDTFRLGNEPYLLAYRAADGIFGIYHLASDLSVSPPFTVYMSRITPTTGFTTVAPFTALGAQYVLGYNWNDGTVAAFSVAVTTSSVGGVPPLRFSNTWYHQWARGWTHFAFFQLGGANFFFKINNDKLNVNIDHLQDNPAAGTVEVGSYLQAQLPDALAIDRVARVPWSNGEPYILTFIASSGETAIYHIHADCLGWTLVAHQTMVAGASLVIPYRADDKTYALFYGGGK